MSLIACPTVRPLPVCRGIRRVVAIECSPPNRAKRPAEADRFLLLFIGFEAYNRELFCLFSYFPAFQSKNHIGSSLKISLVLFPAYTTFAML